MNATRLLGALACLAALPLASGVFAQQAAPVKLQHPVQFRGDSLDARKPEGILILNGNVVVEHGDTTITSDNMTIRYGDDGQTIERMEANGNVRLTEPNRRGRSEKAVYAPITQTLVMTGSPALWEDGDQLTGSEITIYRNPDRLNVKQARAVVQPDTAQRAMQPQTKPTETTD